MQIHSVVIIVQCFLSPDFLFRLFLVACEPVHSSFSSLFEIINSTVIYAATPS